MTTGAHPVHCLREHAIALEAAITVCLAEPTEKAVHDLRRETREVEAQVALLMELDHGAQGWGGEQQALFRKAAARLSRGMNSLRKAAGGVRDLDVQRNLLSSIHAELHTEAPALAPVLIAETVKAARQAKRLRKHLTRQRAAAAAKLVRRLQKREAKLARALEALLAIVELQQDRSVSPAALLENIAEAYRRHRALIASTGTDDDLHAVRKAAKRARYQIDALSVGDSRQTNQIPHFNEESGALGRKARNHRRYQIEPISVGHSHQKHKMAPMNPLSESRNATSKAKKRGSSRNGTDGSIYQNLQRSGGVWHDWLQLSHTAARKLGRHRQLTQLAEERARQHRAIYEQLIAGEKA
jgi:hypothetical protein